MASPKEKRPGPGRPKDEELPARRRAEIITHAIAEFARSGYAGADLDRIAKDAGYSKGTLYNYFASKGALFNASVDHVMVGLKSGADFDDDGDALEQLEKLVTRFLTYFAAHPEYVELLVQERSDFRDRDEPTYSTYRAESRERWNKRLREMMADGRMRQMPADRALNVIGDALYGTIFMNYFRGRKPNPAKQAKEVLDVLLGGLLTEEAFLARSPKSDSDDLSS